MTATDTAAAEPRTDEEIRTRLAAVAAVDMLGSHYEVLAAALSYDAAVAADVVADGCTREQWERHRFVGDELARRARSYLDFAIGKIVNHRGISASRSVGALAGFAWLMRRGDVATAMDSAPYAQYGAPKVRAFALGMGWGEDWEAAALPALERMAEGRPCRPACAEGCGR